MNNHRSISFWDADANTWYGYALAHLLALHYFETPGLGAGSATIELFFSTDLVVIEGKNLSGLFNFIAQGCWTGTPEEEHACQVVGVGSHKYEDHLKKASKGS